MLLHEYTHLTQPSLGTGDTQCSGTQEGVYVCVYMVYVYVYTCGPA